MCMCTRDRGEQTIKGFQSNAAALRNHILLIIDIRWLFQSLVVVVFCLFGLGDNKSHNFASMKI